MGSILTAVQGVDWRRLGEALFPYKAVNVNGKIISSWPKLDEIGEQYQSNDDRLCMVVKTWMQGGGWDKEPSWRYFIWRLDRGNLTTVADSICYFAEPLPGKPAMTPSL